MLMNNPRIVSLTGWIPNNDTGPMESNCSRHDLWDRVWFKGPIRVDWTHQAAHVAMNSLSKSSHDI